MHHVTQLREKLKTVEAERDSLVAERDEECDAKAHALADADQVCVCVCVCVWSSECVCARKIPSV